LNAGAAYLLYDGECPFCARYAALIRLRDAAGPVALIDARQGGPEVEAAAKDGFDLNEGMLLCLHGRTYFGAECIHRLALMTTPVGAFNRLNAMIFRSRMLSMALYPVMKAGRNLTLALLGRKRLPRQGPP